MSSGVPGAAATSPLFANLEPPSSGKPSSSTVGASGTGPKRSLEYIHSTLKSGPCTAFSVEPAIGPSASSQSPRSSPACVSCPR